MGFKRGARYFNIDAVDLEISIWPSSSAKRYRVQNEFYNVIYFNRPPATVRTYAATCLCPLSPVSTDLDLTLKAKHAIRIRGPMSRPRLRVSPQTSVWQMSWNVFSTVPRHVRRVYIHVVTRLNRQVIGRERTARIRCGQTRVCF